jgi:hypothetical protein
MKHNINSDFNIYVVWNVGCLWGLILQPTTIFQQVTLFQIFISSVISEKETALTHHFRNLYCCFFGWQTKLVCVCSHTSFTYTMVCSQVGTHSEWMHCHAAMLFDMIKELEFETNFTPQVIRIFYIKRCPTYNGQTLGAHRTSHLKKCAIKNSQIHHHYQC